MHGKPPTLKTFNTGESNFEDLPPHSKYKHRRCSDGGLVLYFWDVCWRPDVWQSIALVWRFFSKYCCWLRSSSHGFFIWLPLTLLGRPSGVWHARPERIKTKSSQTRASHVLVVRTATPLAVRNARNAPWLHGRHLGMFFKTCFNKEPDECPQSLKQTWLWTSQGAACLALFVVTGYFFCHLLSPYSIGSGSQGGGWNGAFEVTLVSIRAWRSRPPASNVLTGERPDCLLLAERRTCLLPWSWWFVFMMWFGVGWGKLGGPGNLAKWAQHM